MRERRRRHHPPSFVCTHHDIFNPSSCLYEVYTRSCPQIDGVTPVQVFGTVDPGTVRARSLPLGSNTTQPPKIPLLLPLHPKRLERAVYLQHDLHRWRPASDTKVPFRSMLFLFFRDRPCAFGIGIRGKVVLFGELVGKWERGVEDSKVIDFTVGRRSREIKSVIDFVRVRVPIELSFERIVFRVARRRKCAG